MAHQYSYSAQMARYSFMGKYWNFRSYKAELLPSFNLSGNLMNFDRSIVEARDPDTGRLSYVENNSLYNQMRFSVDQNLPWLGGGQLSFQTNLSRLDQFNYDLQTFNTEPFILNYSQPLRRYNSLRWRQKTEPLEFENAKRAYMERLQEITITVTNLFFQALEIQSTYQQYQATYRDLEQMFGFSQKRHELGTLNKSEILQLELSMLNAKMNINTARLTLENRLFNLFSYLRIINYDQVTLSPPYTIPDIFVSVDEVVQKAYANSTHSITQDISLLGAEQAVAQAKANTGLQISLNARLGLSQSANAFNAAYRNLKDNEVVGITFSLPVYDWGLGKGKIRMAKAQLDLTKTELEQGNIEFMQNIRTKVMQFNNQSEQCRTSQRAQDIAEERYEIMKKRFENGTVTVTELNTAQQEFESARNQYFNQLQTFWSDYYAIQKLSLYDYIRQQDLDIDFDEIIK